MDRDRVRNHHLPQHIRRIFRCRPFLSALSRHADRRRSDRNLRLHLPALPRLHRYERHRQHRLLPVIDRDIRYVNGIKPFRLRKHIVADKGCARKILIQGKPLVHRFKRHPSRLPVLVRPQLIDMVLLIIQHGDKHARKRHRVVGSPRLHR